MRELKKLNTFENLGIYFNVEYFCNGKLISEDLIPNGQNILVDKQNVEEYVYKRYFNILLSK